MVWPIGVEALRVDAVVDDLHADVRADDRSYVRRHIVRVGHDDGGAVRVVAEQDRGHAARGDVVVHVPDDAVGTGRRPCREHMGLQAVRVHDVRTPRREMRAEAARV